MKLRRALETDRAFLTGLFVERKRAELAAAGWPEAVLTAFLDSQAAMRERALAAAESWVLLEDDGPVGQLLLLAAPGELQVVEVVVATARRGQGLGTAALRQVIARADAERLQLRLTVERGNPAERLYRRLGFADAGPGDALGLPMVRPAPNQIHTK